MKKSKMKKYPIDRVFNAEARLLAESREFARIVHSTGNIRASGDELEIPFRNFLTSRIPPKYYVGQGHIVDQNLNISPQFDVIIVDANYTNILYSSKNDTQYFPYESVYAIGEVKTTYSKKDKQVKKFIKSLDDLYRNFERKCNNINGINTTRTETFDDIFTFAFFGDSNDLDINEFLEQNKASRDGILLNLSIFLDGRVFCSNIGDCNEDSISNVNILKGSRSQIGGPNNLKELKFHNENINGKALAAFLFALIDHCDHIEMNKSNFKNYLSSWIE